MSELPAIIQTVEENNMTLYDKKISIIIPTLNAQEYMPGLIDILKRQTRMPDEIIVADSQSQDDTTDMARNAGYRVLEINRSDFDHGGTRNYALEQSSGDIVLFLSHDALPTDECYVENLIKGFEDDEVVMISGRQLPRKNARADEALVRKYNYPSESFTRTMEDIPRLGIKAYFFSDVCSAYRRDFFEEIGGFENPILTNEDMLMAARALKAGKKIGYCAQAMVYHSHNYTFKQQYRRNFDIAVFMETYSKEIDATGTTGEGMKMVWFIEKELISHFKLIAAFHCMLDSAAKLLGNRAGKRWKRKHK